MAQVDSYSAFYDNGGFSETELEGILHEHGITTVIVTGFSLDICVYYTSKDAVKIGFNVYTVEDASRLSSGEDSTAVRKDLESLGVHVIDSADLDQVFSAASTPPS